MMKLRDVFKHNNKNKIKNLKNFAENEAKQSEAIVNQNNPVKPKTVNTGLPLVNNQPLSPIEQIRTTAPKVTTPFAPARTNVGDMREEIKPANRFNSFMQTPMGQEISNQAREKYSYFNDIDDYIGRSSYNRWYLPESIKFNHTEATKRQDAVIEFTQGREMNDLATQKEYEGLKFSRDRFLREENNKKNELKGIYNDISEHLSDNYSPEQISDYYKYYSRVKPNDTDTLEAIKKAEQLYYSKAEQREYNEAFENAQKTDAETLAIIEKGKHNYEVPHGFFNKKANEEMQKIYDENNIEGANFRNYVFGKFEKNTAEKMWQKYLNDKANKGMLEASKENPVLKNVAMPIYNIGTQLLSPIYGAEMLAQNTKNMYSGENKPVSMYSSGSAVMASKDASAEAFTVGDSEGTTFLKNVLLSVGGNAANVALFGAATPYMMALQSGSSTAYETMKKGGTTQQAVLNGVIGGTIEYFTEKLPFDELTKTFAGAKGLKNMSKADVTKFLVSRIGSQAVAEYGEETVNSYASTMADIIIMGEKSDYMKYVNELVENGKSTEQAYEMANKKFFLTDPQMAGLSGLISGGLMSSGSVALGTMRAASEGKGQVVINSGKELNPEAVKMVSNLSKAGGANIAIEDLAPVEVTDENGNKKYMKNLGETDADGTIRINSSEMGSVEDALVAYHEVTHALENTEVYDAYRDIALNIMYGGRNTDAYNQAMSSKSAEYGDKAQGTDLLEKELVAEFTKTQLSNEGVVERIVKENRNVATRIYNALKKAYTNIKNKLQGKEANLTDVEKAINLFEKALAENRKMTFTEAVVRGNTNTGPYIDDEGNVQFSERGSVEKKYAIETLPDGRRYVQADRQVMFSSDPDSWGADLENYVNDEIRKGNDVKVTSEDGNVLTITAKTAWKLGSRNEIPMPDGTKRLMTDDEYATKLTAGSHIDEIAQLLKGNDKYKDDKKNHDFAKDGFTYKNAFFRDFDGTYYKLDVSIGKNGEIKSIYNIGKMQKRSFPVSGSSSPKGGARKNGKASKNNIPHQGAIVNNNDMQKGQNNAQGKDGSQHLLGGETSVVANNKTLAEARRMNLKGEPQAEIFRETGWYFGLDRKWKTEIDSADAGLFKNVAEPKIDAPEYNSTAKSRTRLERYENEAVRNIADAMSVRQGTAREFLKPIIQEMSSEYMKTGKLSDETIDRLFEEAYKNGKKVNDEAYKEYADLRNYLRNTKIYIDKEDASDIPDFFKEIRRYMGRLSVSSTNGTSVDSIYQELNEMHPTLFPDTVYAPSDRMLKIMEVSDDLRKTETTLDTYYNTEELKSDLKHEFEEAVYKFRDNLWGVKHFNDFLEKAEVKPGAEIDADSMKSVYNELKAYQKEAEKVMNKILLTEDEKSVLEDMLKGKRTASAKYIPDGLNKDNLMKAYEAMAPVRAMQNIVEEHKKAVRKNKNDAAMKMIELSDFWKDKKVLGGLRYATETQERNIYDIVKDKKQAEKIIEKYFTPVHDHEAERTRFKHNYFDRVRDMNIDLRVRHGNKNTESEAVQFIGEVEGDIADLEAKAKKRKLTDDENDRLINLKGSLVEFKESNPNLDYNKINNCIKEFHKIYDELFEEMNSVRIRNGYAPVEYRKNYFPHFMETGTDDITGKIAKALGINVDVTELPTDLTGRTENFKPGITWVQHTKRRNTNETKYDAIEGFQKYIEGVSDVIFHTDDIQNLRAFERAIRYKYSEKGVKDEIDSIRDNPNITDEERETLIEKAWERDITSLGNYVNNLTEYTNLLANKKSMHDRSFESDIGRWFYNVINGMSKRLAKNMVLGNLSTAITNFIPMHQATAALGDINMLIGYNQTVKNIFKKDGFDERSVFLTNRFLSGERLAKDSKIEKALAKPMNIVDELTSGTIWRAKYHQCIKKGMSDADAIKEADKYAAGLIADRSKGALPTYFGRKNPAAKILSAFQVEPNNQIRHLFKDFPKEVVDNVILGIIRLVLGAYLFNDVYEKICGRRPALDPIGWINEFVGDVSGKKLNNSVDILLTLCDGDVKVIEEVRKKERLDIAVNVIDNVGGNLPFAGGALGLAGGVTGLELDNARLPIASAFPDVGKIGKSFAKGVSNKKRAQVLSEELGGTVAMFLMPYGGNQISKTAKGMSAYTKGGSYKLNNKGEKELQYPIEGDLLTGAQSVVFGKNATEGARKWVDEGFGSLTSEQTELYKEMIKDKNTKNTDIYNAINSARKAKSISDGDNSKSTDQVVHETLERSKGLTPSQKAKVEISFYSKGEDGNKGKREKAQDLIDFGIAPEKVTKLYYDYDVHDDVSKEAEYEKFFGMTDGRTKKVYEKWGYEPKMSVIKREALANDNSLSPEEKQEVNKALFGDNEAQYDFSSVDNYYYSILTESQQEGYDTYIKNFGENSINTRTFYYVVKVMGSQKDGKGSGRDAKIARLRKIGVPINQAYRIYNILK